MVRSKDRNSLHRRLTKPCWLARTFPILRYLCLDPTVFVYHDDEEYDVPVSYDHDDVRDELVRLRKECGRLKSYTSKQDAALDHAWTQASTLARDRNRILLELDETRDQLMDEERRSASLSRKYIKVSALLDTTKSKPGEDETDIPSRSLHESQAEQTSPLMESQENVPTLAELEANINRTLTRTVTRWIRDWHFRLPPALFKDGHLLQHTLVQLFRACQSRIERRHEEVVSVFRCNTHPGPERDAHVETHDSVRKHLRRHHLLLFPLQGDDRERAITDIVSKVAKEVANNTSIKAMHNPDAINRSLVSSGVDKVVVAYLHILVTSVLQQPAVVFTKECGMVQDFDLNVHSPPIDGDELKPRCIVVFPALISTKDGYEKTEAISKRYVLPFIEGSETKSPPTKPPVAMGNANVILSCVSATATE